MGFETPTAPPAPVVLPVHPASASLSYYDLPVAELAPAAIAQEVRKKARLGPNLWAAIGWTVAVLAANFLFSYSAYYTVWYTGGMFGTPVDDAKFYSDPWAMTVLIAASSSSAAFIALLAAFVHARTNFIERLQLRLPRLHHWVFAALAFFPMGILGIEAAAIVGEISTGSYAELHRSTNEVNAVPAIMMLVFCCLFPGVFEELLMRAVIGKSLTERFGIWGGVAITSILFGIPHRNPSHIASAAMMGVFLHLMFIYSRSFWVPVAIHAVNNALAFFGARMQESVMEVSSAPESNHVDAALLIATLCATLTLFLCWRRFRAKPAVIVEAQEIPLAALAPPTKPREWRWLLFIGLAVTHLLFYALLFKSP